MTRVHDMGGRFGDGPVTPEPEDVKFHADWHPRAMAVTVAAGATGLWNIDMSRAARENLDPEDYARFSYYEKWLAALADKLVLLGLVTPDELAAGTGERSPFANKCLVAQDVKARLDKGSPVDRPATTPPRFAPGARVHTRSVPENRLVPGGHTRLPAYAAGVTGTVVVCHGNHVLPDANAHRLGEQPEPLYAVSFAASDLWEAPEHPNDEVVLDLWQSYLEPAE